MLSEWKRWYKFKRDQVASAVYSQMEPEYPFAAVQIGPESLLVFEPTKLRVKRVKLEPSSARSCADKSEAYDEAYGDGYDEGHAVGFKAGYQHAAAEIRGNKPGCCQPSCH